MQSADDAATAVQSLSYISVRFTTFLSIVVVIGAVLFLRLIVPRVEEGEDAERAEEIRSRLRVLGLGASIALLALAAARLALQRQALTQMLGDSTAVPLDAILVGSWGIGLALQIVGAIAAILAFTLRDSNPASAVARTVALVIAVSPALSGHAAGEESVVLPIVADSLHVLAAGAWAGMLASLAIVALPNLSRSGGPRAAQLAHDMLGAFSPLALGSAAVLAITGTYAAWLHLAGIPSLWTSQYGQALLWKLAMVGVMALIGALNWKRNGPAVGEEGGLKRLSRAAWFELAIAVLILLITAVLVGHATPADLVG